MGALFPVKEPAGCGGVTPDRNILPLPRIERRTLSHPAWRVLAKQQIAYSFDNLQHHAPAICGPPVRVAVIHTCAWIYCDVSLSDREMSLKTNCQRIDVLLPQVTEVIFVETVIGFLMEQHVEILFLAYICRHSRRRPHAGGSQHFFGVAR